MGQQKFSGTSPGSGGAGATAATTLEPPRRLHRSTPRFGPSGSLGNECTGYRRLRTRPSEGTSPPPPRRRQRAPPRRKTPIALLGAFHARRRPSPILVLIINRRAIPTPRASAMSRFSRQARLGLPSTLQHASSLPRSRRSSCAAAQHRTNGRRRAGLRDDAAQPTGSAAADPGANTSRTQQAP